MDRVRSANATRLIAALVVCFVILAVVVYVSTTAGAIVRFGESRGLSHLGPSSTLRQEHVKTALRAALESLDRAGVAITDETTEYEARLNGVKRILQCGLTIAPLDAPGAAQLAAVNWELSVLRGEVDDDVQLIHLAASRSPQSADLQLDVGTLLLRLGHTSDALSMLSKAAELDADLSERIVETLQGQPLAPAEILRAFPEIPAMAIALRAEFFAAGEVDAYLSELERLSRNHPAEVLRFYGNTALISGRSQRLIDFLEPIDLASNPIVEAERHFVLSRAHLELGDTGEALRDIDAALAARPALAEFTELRADCLLRLGRPTEAVHALEAAIHEAVTANWSPEIRTRLYRSLAAAYRADARGDLAYDALRRALELSPDNSVIQQEFERLSGRAQEKRDVR